MVYEFSDTHALSLNDVSEMWYNVSGNTGEIHYVINGVKHATRLTTGRTGSAGHRQSIQDARRAEHEASAIAARKQFDEIFSKWKDVRRAF